MFGKTRPSKWSWKYPPGAITTREVLQDIIIEARKERKAIRLYGVCQMGHFETWFLTSKSRLNKPESKVGLCSGDSFYSVPAYKLSSFTSRHEPKHRFYRDKFLCGSYSIGTLSNEYHRMFQNARLAREYAEELKNDPEYVLSVKEHWARCEKAFSRYAL